jgi:hypothetical protein
MTGLLERAADFFLAPEMPAGPPVATVPDAARTVVVGARRDALPLAAAVALVLRVADRAAAAVVAVWASGDPRPLPRGPATPAASRLAARLSGRQLPAVARGRLVWLRLPGDPHGAATAVRRAVATVDGPVVTAIGGARPAALDDLVAEHDLVVVAADPSTPLAGAALARLTDCPALACRPLPRPGRALALAGLAAPRIDPPLRAASMPDDFTPRPLTR